MRCSVSRATLALVLFLVTAASAAFAAQTVVFYEPGFPVADSPAFQQSELQVAFQGAHFVSASELPAALSNSGTDLLVMPYGSAYPEAAWPAILRYLDRGGNLLALGGKPFTRAAYLQDKIWRLRAPSVAASLELFIQDYQETPGSAGLTFAPNRNINPETSPFTWTHAWSPMLRLSAVNQYNDGGGTGGEDADLTTLAWGERNGHKLAAPLFEIDHYSNRFVGGRWIFAACDPGQDFFKNADLLTMLTMLATRHEDRFTFRPRVPLFLPGEALEFVFHLANPLSKVQPGDQLKIHATVESGAPPVDLMVPVGSDHAITLPAAAENGHGFHTVEATLLRGGKPLRTYRSGFWMRDWNYLLSGPRLTVGGDYFELNGKPLPVVGTTYMASDVQRMYLMRPNAYIWDQDMKQIHDAGLEMIRTGLWTAWTPELGPDGAMTGDALRTVEAFLMCARHNDLPVQFNLFSFSPENFGGVNGYLDPASLAGESVYVDSLVKRFHAVPFLAWDLNNEPSANSNWWKTLPIRDSFERKAWREWLVKRYPDQASLLAAWAEPSFGIGRQSTPQLKSIPPEVEPADPLALPQDGAFGVDSVRSGFNPLKTYDYFLFSQSVFDNWVRQMRGVIRADGSSQLITVGQEENGVGNRLSPAFYSPLIDFTADHTWWNFDAILWASLAAKLPGKPMLIQETGEQRRLTQDYHLRLTAEEEGWQLERKIATAFAQGAGALEWEWNVNAYMADENEITIGAIRPDGTEKPEARVLAGYAAFARKSPGSFTHIEPPAIVMVTSQALQYNSTNPLALEAQMHALRSLAYYDHMPFRFMPENRLAELGTPKLVILPSPQVLTQAAWRQLLSYVAKGGYLLITGPVDRDEHWQFIDRLSPLGVNADRETLDVRQTELAIPGGSAMPVSFDYSVQQLPIQVLRFRDGKSVESISHGKGHILWAAVPVEFAESYRPAATLYSYAIGQAGIKAAFQQLAPLSAGVLAFPTVLDKAVLYSFSNETLNQQKVDIQDAVSGARILFMLPAQRGALLLLRRSDGKVLSAYGAASADDKVIQAPTRQQ